LFPRTWKHRLGRAIFPAYDELIRLAHRAENGSGLRGGPFVMSDRTKLMLLGPVPVAAVVGLTAAASWSRSEWRPIVTVLVMDAGLFAAARAP
jgi:hypothetical protein